MALTTSRLGLTCIALSLATASAQQPIQPPPKNVAVIVDVSRSLRDDANSGRMAEAAEIINSIVSGKGFSGSGWKAEPAAEMRSIFDPYFRPSALLAPLTAPGRLLLFQKAGRYQTVRNSREEVALANVGDFSARLQEFWPSKVPDGSTCYWYAMARVADRLKRISPDGYYLFVVSDEQDDPDYSDEPTDRGTSADYADFRREWRAQGYTESSIQREIERYFVWAGREKGGYPRFRQRDDFPQTLIATFLQDNASRDDRKKVQLRWYGMGVTARSFTAPPPPLAAPPPLEPPTANPVLVPLGGLSDNATKTFSYDQPLMVCQVHGMAPEDASALKLEVAIRSGDSDWKVRPLESPRFTQRGQFVGGAPPTAMFRAEALEPGKEYEVKIKEAGTERGLSTTFQLKIQPKQNLLLNTLAITSAATALGIFIYAWRTLRKAEG